jgi:hypothetical protein
LNIREHNTSLIRIALSSNNPANIGFILDTGKEEDNVIMDNEGVRLLLIDRELSQLLSGVPLDLKETDDGLNYSITQA